MKPFEKDGEMYGGKIEDIAESDNTVDENTYYSCTLDNQMKKAKYFTSKSVPSACIHLLEYIVLAEELEK